MKKIFLDTNILLDVLLDRSPYVHPAQVIWSLAEKKKIRAAVSALSLRNVFFIIKKLSSSEKGYKAVETLVDLFQIVEVGSKMIQKALEIRLPDFEDAIQYYAALKFRAGVMISRDRSGFKASRIPIMDSAEFVAQWGED